MAIQDQMFSLAGKVIRVISLRNVILWVLTAALIVSSVTLFENRHIILNRIIDGPTDVTTNTSFRVSKTSQDKAKSIVDNTDVINSVVVMNADIRNNKRQPVFYYASDPTLQKVLDGFYSGKTSGIALFTNEVTNNETIIGMINGEFACVPYQNGFTTSFPNLQSAMPWICKSSLPPYYGQFSGYVTLSLTRQPTGEEVMNLKSDANTIATEIYFRDILPKK